MPACHAGGHEFESRTHRRNNTKYNKASHRYTGDALFCFLTVNNSIKKEAISLAYKARKSGVKSGERVSPFARQQNLFAFDDGATVSDYTNATIMMLADIVNGAKVTELKKTISIYNDRARDAASGQSDIFSAELKTKEDILKEVNELLNYGTEEAKESALSRADASRRASSESVGAESVEQDGTAGVSRERSADVEDSVQAALTAAEQETNTEPTDAQKEAGNYKKGHVKIDGYNITIENPKGSERSGLDKDGKKWSITMNNTYGYILGTEGVDGDHIDVFLSDNPSEGNVYVVDQVNADGSFDEHKVMYGFPDIESARKAYLSNYEEGWQGLGNITGVSKEEFKKWVDSSHRKTKPFAEYSNVKPLGDIQAKESRETALRDGLIDKLRSAGIEVITDEEEAKRVLDADRERRARLMGSRVEKRKQEIAAKLEGKEMSYEQRTVVNVFTGRNNNLTLNITDKSGKSRSIVMRQGNEQNAGTKHSIYRHYMTDNGHITADDILLVPDVVANGERKPVMRGKTQLYEYMLKDGNGTLYTVLTEKDKGREVFADFYTNRKTSLSARKTRSEEARDIDNSDVTGAKLQKVSDFANYSPVYYSNAEKAVEGISQNKATAEQWLAMIQKQGGLKAGEDKWLGLRDWLKNDVKGKVFTIELPVNTLRMIHRVMGRDFESHNITSNGIRHGLKNHGVGGNKLTEKSIPVRNEDAELIPYIMTAPDYVEKSSTDITGRESLRFYKSLSNGYVVVVEKEYKNSPDDMDTITMWANLSSLGADARSGERPLHTTSQPTNVAQSANAQATNVRTVIQSFDAAKIRKDAETAIKNDEKVSLHKVFHGSGNDFERFDHSHMGEGEGAQAYGWGTYVTEVEGIGKTYANASSRPTYKGYDRKTLDSSRELSIPHDEKIAARILLKNLHTNYSDALERTRTFFKTRAERFDKRKDWTNRDFMDYFGCSRSEVREYREESKRKVQEYTGYLEALNKISETDIQKKERVLYTVEIPEDAETYYLDYTLKMGDQQDILEGVDNVLYAQGWHREELDSRIRFTKGQSQIILTPNQSGADLYAELEDALGSDKLASEFLHDEVGVTGMKYPAEYTSGGRSDGAMNYVIFDEKDLKITDKIKFLRTSSGEAYGFTKDGKIYIDPRKATAETPVHEFTHLWADGLRKANPKAWERLKGELEKEKDLFDYVKSLYPELSGDDLMDEVFAHFSGKRGAERLRSEQEKMMQKANGIFDKAKITTMFDKLRNMLHDFWAQARDLFAGKTEGIEKLSAEDFADMALADLIKGEKPLVEGKKEARYNKAAGLDVRTYDNSNHQTRDEERVTLGELVSGDRQLRDMSDNELDSEYMRLLDVVEKPARIDKLRSSKSVEIKPSDNDGKYKLNAESAQKWIKDNLRGKHVINDTGETVEVSKIGAEEVTSHNRYDEAHLKSISKIPSMLENAVFLGEEANTKGNRKFDSYRYYAVGLNIDGVDYTAKIVIGVKQGKKYYDHRLIQLEKSTLIDMINQPASGFTTAENASLPPYANGKDKRLLSILQVNVEEISQSEQKMREILDEMKRRRGYDSNTDYQGSLAFNGAAPSRNAYFDSKTDRMSAFKSGEFEGDYSLGDYMDNGLDNNDLGWQLANPIAASGRDKATLESIRNLMNVVKNKDRRIKMYRAVDASIKENKFRNGDWITPSREYAERHIGLQEWKNGRVIEEEVSVDDIWWNGDDINEWGFDDGKGYAYKNVRNNRKSKKAYSYEVTKIEVLDGQTTKPLPVSSRKSNTPNGRSNVSNVFVSGAKLLKDFEKKHDGGKKILDESKKVDEKNYLYREQDESEDVYDAGRRSLEETFTQGLIDLSEKNRSDVGLRISAMKAISSNLSELRSAMSRQREYDKSTVNRIVRWARMLMESGIGGNLTRYEVKRLTGMIAQAAGKEDITRQAGQVMDLLINNQLRASKDLLQKQMRIKGSKIDSRGVEVQGALDIRGQRMIGAFKEGISLGEDASYGLPVCHNIKRPFGNFRFTTIAKSIPNSRMTQQRNYKILRTYVLHQDFRFVIVAFSVCCFYHVDAFWQVYHSSSADGMLLNDCSGNVVNVDDCLRRAVDHAFPVYVSCAEMLFVCHIFYFICFIFQCCDREYSWLIAVE